MRRFACLFLVALSGALLCAGSAAAASSSVAIQTTRIAGWTGPISVTITADSGDDPTDTYTLLWDGSSAAVLASGGGACTTTAGAGAMPCHLASGATAGTHTLEVRDDLANAALSTQSVGIQKHLTSRLVKLAPLTFTPFKHDHVTDKLNLTFINNKQALVGFQVKNKGGKILRHGARNSFKAGRHIIRWSGLNDSGKLVTPNVHYWIRLVSTVSGESVTGTWHKIYAKKVLPPKKPPTGGGGGGGTPPPNCTPGYSPCLIYHGGADYDCAGGGGNGPYYTKPNTVYHVNDSEDIYGLDGNNNGLGCE